MTVNDLLIIAAVICFGLATFGVSTRINLVALGLLLVTLALAVL